MGKLSSPKDVRYLALEGGGGKGVAFLGAVKALESDTLGNILPIKPFQSNQIKGISGSSAGAITALLLCLGYDSISIERLLSRGSAFDAFFDVPHVNRCRGVNSQGQPYEVVLNKKHNEDITESRLWSSDTFLIALSLLAKQFLGNKSTPPAKMITKYPTAYLHNLLYDCGVFPGFAVRKFFQELIGSQVAMLLGAFSPESATSRRKTQHDTHNISFKSLRDITGVDLVITGTNVSWRKPMLFNADLTPNFPVAEAVGISMNLPIIFKPVTIDEGTVAPGGASHKSTSQNYSGLWVDGGTLNNLPMHAFDHLTPGPKTHDLNPLNPNVLGLRLTDGWPPQIAGLKRANIQGTGISERQIRLKPYGVQLLETLLYPSEEGQIRTESERDQLVDLYTFDLELLDFAPSVSKKEFPIAHSEQTMFEYFK